MKKLVAEKEVDTFIHKVRGRVLSGQEKVLELLQKRAIRVHDIDTDGLLAL
jgi:hypothetical protein